jgi:two-component system phosphate regulon response regulator PhoB
MRAAVETTTGEAGMKTLTILYAEDDEAFRLKTVAELESLGHTVTAVADGEALLKELNNNKPDLVITDDGMPGLNGFEVLHIIRDSGRYLGLPVIMYTSEPNAKSDVVRLGAFFVRKDETPDPLKQAIERLFPL